MGVMPWVYVILLYMKLIQCSGVHDLWLIRGGHGVSLQWVYVFCYI